jgi:fumarate hydratase class I
MEAIYEFEVKDTPVTVAVDTKGESAHHRPSYLEQEDPPYLAVEIGQALL